ncbi:MAG: GNAT family N-acetyltransferase [Bacteroidota bacterium]
MNTIIIEQIRPELTWRLRRDVMYPDQNISEMKMPEDNDGYHFAAFNEKYIIGVISLFHKGTDFQFRKFAVANDEQGKGTGTILLSYVLDFAIAMGAKRIWCNSRVTAIGFYQRFGMVQTGKTYSNIGIDYEVMEKIIES